MEAPTQGPTGTDLRNLSPSQSPEPSPARHTYGTQSLSVPAPRPEQPLTCTDTPGTEGHHHREPPTRLQPAQLTDELGIVWLTPLDGLDYVREGLDITKRRAGRPAYHGHGRLVGYADLRPDALATRDSGRYDRRTFWLLPHDRGESPDTEYRTHAPLEAVDPRTVLPRLPGRLTDRAWGSPLPRPPAAGPA
ncbi:DUF6009 family protein [Streptomyces yaizuensis]|uniref:DUF6009 family protein n=1 Tax=Streptomyces yaizuensis TaxID=2989713 RepID=A0ABQ5P6J9_9ACTN|nr:DUF6009 family protein [Streptomyces sp. YSPA8]GLF98223.1 DUF6009 family protein [Streptomyces sp. YSPA8]